MDILKKPLITEKLPALGEKLNRYGFKVESKSNKIEIKKAIEALYGVNVEAVNTMKVPAKAKSRMTKKGIVSGRKSGYKKAIVTLAKGETIDFYAEI